MTSDPVWVSHAELSALERRELEEPDTSACTGPTTVGENAVGGEGAVGGENPVGGDGGCSTASRAPVSSWLALLAALTAVATLRRRAGAR